MKNIIVIKLGGIAIENLNDEFIQQINAWHLENKNNYCSRWRPSHQ